MMFVLQKEDIKKSSRLRVSSKSQAIEYWRWFRKSFPVPLVNREFINLIRLNLLNTFWMSSMSSNSLTFMN